MKEKIQRLEKYRSKVKDQLASPTPEKHKNHPKEYTRFLEKELADVTRAIDKLKLV
jgi:hypothetical protein